MSAQLSHLGDPALHFFLTRSVARACDVNLSDAMAQGRLSANEYADMVTRCRKCPYVGQCQQWLAKNGANAEHAPEGCAHRALLDNLH